MSSESSDLLAIVVGNTNTRFARFIGKEPDRPGRAPNADLHALAARIEALAPAPSDPAGLRVVVATSNPPVRDHLLDLLNPRLRHDLLLVGADIEVPIPQALDPAARPGQDRLLNALAAYDTLHQACVVVDAGTAITIDFVDGQGTFQGGAIAPGATMMLRALHTGTAALPAVELTRPDESLFFGKDTTQAMLHGVFFGIRGMVHHLLERYAEAYEAYPTLIATGADAPLLFDTDPLVERIIPDLTLRGIEAALRRLATAQD